MHALTETAAKLPEGYEQVTKRRSALKGMRALCGINSFRYANKNKM